MSCEYCNGEKPLFDEKFNFCNMEIWVTKDIIQFNTYNHDIDCTENNPENPNRDECTVDIVGYFKADFCPKCGDPLTEPKALTLEEMEDK